MVSDAIMTKLQRLEEVDFKIIQVSLYLEFVECCSDLTTC